MPGIYIWERSSRLNNSHLQPTPIFPCPMTLERSSKKNNDDYGFHKYAAAESLICSAAIARFRLNFRNSTRSMYLLTSSSSVEDLCVVGIVVKAITLWGQKCQSSSRTILQLLKISGNRTAAEGSLPIDLENCHPVRQCIWYQKLRLYCCFWCLLTLKANTQSFQVIEMLQIPQKRLKVFTKEKIWAIE